MTSPVSTEVDKAMATLVIYADLIRIDHVRRAEQCPDHQTCRCWERLQAIESVEACRRDLTYAIVRYQQEVSE